MSVLIGSRALYEFGFPPYEDERDFDIISDKCASFFKHAFERVDIQKTSDSESNALILGHDGISTWEKHVMVMHGATASLKVAPLEILYAIYKSHIHRVIYRNGTHYDIQKWYEYVDKYLWLRNRLNYVRADEMIYSEDDDVGASLTANEKLARDVFFMRFEETNRRNGDTRVSMKKTKEEFFDDSVPRFIDHDLLHEKVHKLLSKTSEQQQSQPLYKQFINGDNVEMDRSLFMAAPSHVRECVLVEEIMVLLLERKIIPVLKLAVGTTSTHISAKRLRADMLETLAIFATDLCGQSHHWLRRFVIDHIHVLLAIITDEMLANVYKLACSLCEMPFEDVAATTTTTTSSMSPTAVSKFLWARSYSNFHLKDLASCSSEPKMIMRSYADHPPPPSVLHGFTVTDRAFQCEFEWYSDVVPPLVHTFLQRLAKESSDTILLSAECSCLFLYSMKFCCGVASADVVDVDGESRKTEWYFFQAIPSSSSSLSQMTFDYATFSLDTSAPNGNGYCEAGKRKKLIYFQSISCTEGHLPSSTFDRYIHLRMFGDEAPYWLEDCCEAIARIFMCRYVDERFSARGYVVESGGASESDNNSMDDDDE
jgi:hypothetical protein